MSLQKEPRVPLRRPDESLDRHRVRQEAFFLVDTLGETCKVVGVKMVSVELVERERENEQLNETKKHPRFIEQGACHVCT